jgi:hypothetical protein
MPTSATTSAPDVVRSGRAAPAGSASESGRDDRYVRELLDILKETQSPDAFQLTLMVLVEAKADPRVAVPVAIRNAERLGLLGRTVPGEQGPKAYLTNVVFELVRDLAANYGPEAGRHTASRSDDSRRPTGTGLPRNRLAESGGEKGTPKPGAGQVKKKDHADKTPAAGETRLQKFWQDYNDALRRDAVSPDRIDWVAYYKNHGYQVNGTCQGAGCGTHINYAPVSVAPAMQWAQPADGRGPPAPAAARAAQVGWRADYRKARDEAKAERRPLLVVFRSAHCPWCDKLETAMREDADVSRLLKESVVPVALSAEDHAELAARLQVEAYPTVVVAAPDGKILLRLTGYRDAATLKKEIRQGLAKATVAR